MPVLTVLLVVVLAALTGFATQAQSRRPTAPESFSANANVTGGAGSAAARIAITVERYSPDGDRNAVVQALRAQGYAAFLEALRQAPRVGTLTLDGESFAIRWAREERATSKRTIVLITDQPVYFVGGGSTTAKPRAGYDVAILKFSVDDAGLGYDGVMTAAARVKAGGTMGVEIEDYADKPIRLVTVTRALQ